MPKFDPAEMRAMIADGEVVGFTLDTNVIDGLNSNGNLDNRILLGVGNLRTKAVRAIIADVVAKEVCGHMNAIHLASHDQLTSVVKTYTKIWKQDAAIVDELQARLVPRDTIRDHADALFDKFCDGMGIEIISSDEAISIAELMTSYFEGLPPFAGADKKHEFPDAVALAALRKWTDANGAVLVVSKDKGWSEYCEQSDYLYCANDLGKALALFHEDEAIVAKCLKQLKGQPDGNVGREILRAIQRDLDDLDFEVEASAFMEWDASLEEAVVDSIEYAGGAEQRIVASDGHSVTFVVPVSAKLKVQAGFVFSIHDSIDDDYVSLGGSIKEVSLQHDYQVSVTVSGKGEEEIEIDETDVNSATRLKSVNFGHVEPFYEPEED
ncbi:PIN domain-containing protein [Rhizobium leguminosarum]|uniref:PIN domain-containing protein n=1 Tax=Rhizobium leguminosarum TaxID=384 RepID=UPI003F9D9416